MLRQLAACDVEEIFLLRSDLVNNKYLDRVPCKSLQEALEFIELVRNNSLSYWAISKKGQEKLVGTICIFNVSEELRQGEIGYELLPEYQGEGIMVEAAAKIIDYAIQTLGLQTIEAHTHQANQGSIKLLNRLKFVRANTVVQHHADLAVFRLNTS